MMSIGFCLGVELIDTTLVASGFERGGNGI